MPCCVGTLWGIRHLETLSASQQSSQCFILILQNSKCKQPSSSFTPSANLSVYGVALRSRETYSDRREQRGLPITLGSVTRLGHFFCPQKAISPSTPSAGLLATPAEDSKERSSRWSCADSPRPEGGSGKGKTAWLQKCLPDCSY